jgi:hypothetical protein
MIFTNSDEKPDEIVHQRAWQGFIGGKSVGAIHKGYTIGKNELHLHRMKEITEQHVRRTAHRSSGRRSGRAYGYNTAKKGETTVLWQTVFVNG